MLPSDRYLTAQPLLINHKRTLSSPTIHLGQAGQLNIFGSAGEKRPQWTYAFNWQSDERALLQLEASQITIDKVLWGVMLLTNKFLYFHPRKQTGGLAQESKVRVHIIHCTHTFIIFLELLKYFIVPSFFPTHPDLPGPALAPG